MDEELRKLEKKRIGDMLFYAGDKWGETDYEAMSELVVQEIEAALAHQKNKQRELVEALRHVDSCNHNEDGLCSVCRAVIKDALTQHTKIEMGGE